MYLLSGLEDNMEKKNDLSKQTQITKLKKNNLFLIIFSVVFSIFLISLSVCLIILKEPIELGIGFLICLPISITFGAVLPIKDNNKKINELEKTK
jgi:hypothetical protein